MPNIASILKTEISRVSRKEMRGEMASLKKSTSVFRSEIAALKRRVQALEQQVKRLARTSGRTGNSTDVEIDANAPGLQRFSAKGLASQRKRLGLSAADCGLLLGASAQSVYNWEEGAIRPRAAHLQAIANLKRLGKRDVAASLETLKA